MKDAQRPPIFLIGVNSRFRGHELTRALTSSGFKVYRILGIDGRKIQARWISQIYSVGASKLIHRRELSHGEVACFLGHKRAIRHFLQTPHQWAIILEDDVSPEVDLEAFVSALPEALPEPSVVQFHVFKPVHVRPHATFRDDKTSIQKLAKPSFGAQAYAINRAAALIAREAYRRHKVDSVADWPFRWKHKVQFWWVPGLSRDLESPNAESTIGTNPQKIAAASQVKSRTEMLGMVLPRLLGLNALRGLFLGMPFRPLVQQDLQFATKGLSEMRRGLSRRVRMRRS